MDNKYNFAAPPTFPNREVCSTEGCENTEDLCPGCGKCNDCHKDDTQVSSALNAAMQNVDPQKKGKIRAALMLSLRDVLTARDIYHMADKLYESLKDISLTAAENIKSYVLLGQALEVNRPLTVFELLIDLAENGFVADEAIAKKSMDIDSATISMFIIQAIMGVTTISEDDKKKFMPAQFRHINDFSSKEEKYDAIFALVSKAIRWSVSMEDTDDLVAQINRAIEHGKEKMR